MNPITLNDEHRALLAESAVDVDIARQAGVRSVEKAEDLPEDVREQWADALPALLFPWTGPDGEIVQQLRPDNPRGDAKYLFPRGAVATLWVHPDQRQDVTDSARPILLVEGTKQFLAAVSTLARMPGDDTPRAVGMAGCWGWKSGGEPLPAFGSIPWVGREVVVVLDADMASNPEVHAAAEALRTTLGMYGAGKIRFARIIGGEKDGLDDYLARAHDPTVALNFLWRQAKTALPARPKPQGTRWYGDDGLLVVDLARHLVETHPMALTADDRVAVWGDDGRYHPDGYRFRSLVTDEIGNRVRINIVREVEAEVAAILARDSAYLRDHLDEPLLPVRNGVLDLRTGRLGPHDPGLRLSYQLPLEWNLAATTPIYDRWLAQIIPEQADDLEEVASTMLDLSATPRKAAFLFGPSRSGKSTFLRILEAIVGPERTSAVTLHEMAESRFGPAGLYGKLLNSAGDLPGNHVSDLSAFKMLTSGDPMTADQKYGRRFTFTNRALIVFAGNDLPTNSETSRAYLERIKPFKFGNSFAGHEDPEMVAKLLRELPGILVRLVAAWQRFNARGGYAPTLDSVQRELETSSNRVHLWLAEDMRVVTERLDSRSGKILPVEPGSELPPTHATTMVDLRPHFTRWAAENGGSTMGKQTLKRHMLSARGVVEVRVSPKRARGFNVVPRGDEDEDPMEPGPPSPGSFDSPETVRIDSNGVEAEEGKGEGGRAEPRSGQVQTARGASSAGETARFETAPDQGGSTDPGNPGTFPPETLYVEEEGNRGGYKGGAYMGVLSGEKFSDQTARIAAPAPDSLSAIRGRSNPKPLPGPLTLDLETAGADELFRYGPGFIRLAGYAVGDRPATTTTDVGKLVALIDRAPTVAGHNVVGFDLVALAHYHGLDVERLAQEGRIHDTMLCAVQYDPPPAGENGGQSMRRYSLDTLTGMKLGNVSKMARDHGGYDRIPIDDTYRAYCAGDVEAARTLAEAYPMTDYLRREHRVMARMATMRSNGMRADLPLLRARIEEVAEASRAALEVLHDRFSVPRTDDRGRAYKSPLATDAGKRALDMAFHSVGVHLPRTESGDPALGKEVLTAVANDPSTSRDGRELAVLVRRVNGARSIYGTVRDHLAGDRVHPEIVARQASGRFSVTKPGLTVVGKRGGLARERDIFLPDPGQVILSVDLAQVDARAIAAHCQDPAYMALFASGRDAHTEIAVAVWGDPGRRQEAKVIAHGWNYGLGVAGLVRQGVDRAAAEQFDLAMTERFPRLVEWRTEVREEAAGGAILDNGWGRRMRPDPARAWTQAPALYGQGAARDVLCEGLLRLPDEVLPMMRVVVHDELVLSVPGDVLDDVQREVVEAMTVEWCPPGASIPMVFPADVAGTGSSWGAAYRSED